MTKVKARKIKNPPTTTETPGKHRKHSAPTRPFGEKKKKFGKKTMANPKAHRVKRGGWEG